MPDDRGRSVLQHRHDRQRDGGRAHPASVAPEERPRAGGALSREPGGGGAQAGGERPDREREIKREVLGPEDVDVGALLEVHVLEGGHQQDEDREQLRVVTAHHEASDDHGYRKLAQHDREAGEHHLDPDVSGLGIASTGAVLPCERTLYMLSSSSSLLDSSTSLPNTASDSSAAPTISPK